VFDIDSHQRDAFDCRDAAALQDILAKTFSQVRDTPLSG
jgi:putative methionine-R-sulfoxide reductase with GAF domain